MGVGILSSFEEADRPTHERERAPAGESATLVVRSHGGGGGGESDEVALFLRACRATAHALENEIKVRYRTLEYPSIVVGPNKCFMFRCSGAASCYTFQIRMMDDHFCVNCFFPRSIPPNRRSRVSEFIVRVNRTMIRAQFDLDFSDGEVRVRFVPRPRGEPHAGTGPPVLRHRPFP